MTIGKNWSFTKHPAFRSENHMSLGFHVKAMSARHRSECTILHWHFLFLLVAQNLIGSFDFSKVFYILYCNLPWHHNLVKFFCVNNISSRRANPLFLSIYSSDNVRHYLINWIIRNEANFDVLYMIYFNLGQFMLFYNLRITSLNCPKLQ
jgi:hypothetical protein